MKRILGFSAPSWLVIVALSAACAQNTEIPTGPVRFTVHDMAGVPVKGATVVFHDAKGEISALETTDTAGVVNTTLQAGGMATVTTGTSSLATLAGIQPGDDLVFQPPTPATLLVLGSVDVTLPGVEAAGAVRYLLDVGCERAPVAATGTRNLRVVDTCVTDADTFHVLATAYNSSDEVVAYSRVLDTLAPAGGAKVAVTLGAWQTDLVELPIRVLSGPSEALAAGVAQLELYQGGIRFAIDHAPIGFFGSGTATLRIPIPPDMEGLKGAVGVFYGTGITLEPESLAVRFLDLQTHLPASIDVDAEADLPARIHDYVFDATDPARPQVTFETPRRFDRADASMYVLATSTHYWFVVGPPNTAKSFRYPALPDELASYRPNAAGSVVHELLFADADFVDGFDHARKTFGIGFLMDIGATAPTNPAGGDSRSDIVVAGNALLGQF